MAASKNPPNAETLAADAERYGQRLLDISEFLELHTGDNATEARRLLKGAADSAHAASLLISGKEPKRLRLHVNVQSQNQVLVEAAQYLLESHPGQSPVVFHRGVSQQSLPFAIQITARLVARLRALFGEDKVWTEERK